MEELSDVEGVSFQREFPGSRSIAWMTSISISHPNFDREAFRSGLLERGVETRPVFPSISQYPIWDRQITAQPTSLWVGSNSMNLPSGVRLSHESVIKVCDAIKDLHRVL
jgi:perosamine synthetase